MVCPLFHRKRLSPATAVAIALLSSLLLAIPSPAQKPAPPAPAANEPPAENPQPKTTLTRPGEEKLVLQQLNSAVEELTARISPAVVQISVTGYGTVDENNQAQTAYVARERAIGAGVIVDPDGYIMTNAHVVEGAQRIHVALASPMNSQDPIAPVGKQRILDARL